MANDPFGVGYPPSQVVTSGADLEGLSPAARKMLQGVAETYGKPINVVSGYRSKARNARVGGAGRSQHIHGNAIDISLKDLPDEEKARLLSTAIASGAKGVGIYPGGSLHIDTRDTPTLWGMRPGAAYSGMPMDMAPAWAQDPLKPLFVSNGAEIPAPETLPPMPANATPAQPLPGRMSDEYRGAQMPGPGRMSAEYAQPQMEPQGDPAQAAEQMAGGQPPEITIRPDGSGMQQPQQTPEAMYSEMVGRDVYGGGGGMYYFDDPMSKRAIPVNSDPRVLALVNAIKGGGNGAA